MPPKKRKAAAADSPQSEPEHEVFYIYDDDVFVLTSESVTNEAHDMDVKVYGVFTKWLDLKAKVLEMMEQDPVALFDRLNYDEIEKEIYHDRLEEECESPFGVEVASYGVVDGPYTFTLKVHRTSLQ